jgi:hypothetical protein
MLIIKLKPNYKDSAFTVHQNKNLLAASEHTSFRKFWAILCIDKIHKTTRALRACGGYMTSLMEVATTQSNTIFLCSVQDEQ